MVNIRATDYVQRGCSAFMKWVSSGEYQGWEKTPFILLSHGKYATC